MKYFLFFLFALAAFCAAFCAFSCASFDVDKNLGESGAGKQHKNTGPVPDNAVLVFPEPEIVYIDRPVIIPPEEKPPKSPAAGRDSVNEANNKGIIKPHDYSHAAIVYIYNPDEVYEVFAQPLRVCDLVMEVNERISDIPYVSDSERWVIGAGVSYENGNPIQHVYVKPELYGISASLIINTDRRVYRIILRSYADVHMPLVRWRYISGLPNNYIPSPQAQNNTNNNSQDAPFAGIDPRHLSFNYRVKYSFFNKPVWLPNLVFDDGSKTLIQFPDIVLQRELPAVFENRKNILNYRVTGNLIVIDKLIEEITIKIGRTEVTVIKKRGKNGR
jgi:type IV secretion system protein TrbG